MIAKCGLPLAEMFIWGDDVEFFERITKADFVGIYCSKSEVLHKTAENYNVNITTDKPNNLWKYRFGIRNDLYIQRLRHGYGIFVLYTLKKFIFENINILRHRSDNRLAAIQVNSKAILDSYFFRPTIKRL
jgi:GT2 family glycosyltransferase